MIATFGLSSLIALLLLIHVWFKRNFTYWSRHTNIPSVRGRIFSDSLKNVLTMKTNFYARLKDIYADPKYCDEAVVGIYGAYKPCLLIREPRLIRQILIKDFDCFHDRAAASSRKHDPTGFNMMFFMPYELWRETRPKFTQIFSAGKLKKFQPNIQQICEILERRLNAAGERSVQDIWQLSGFYVIDALASFIGVTSNCLTNPQGLFQKTVLELGKYNVARALNYLVLFFMPSLRDLFRVRVAPKHLETLLKAYIESALKERETAGDSRNDVIDLFVKYKREFKGTQDEQQSFMNTLTAQAILFLMAGVETTMVTTTYVMYELAKHRDVQEKLRQQLMCLLRESNGEIVWDSLNRLEYLECVINETMRMYPALQAVERQYCKTSGRDYTLKPYYDFTLPAGMPIYISLAGLNADPKIWPNPTQFDPDRFLAANMTSHQNTAFIPFGDGPHNCIGGLMGMLMMKTFVAHILRSYNVRICEQTETEIEFDMNAKTLQPSRSIYLEMVREDMRAKADHTNE